MGSWLSTDNSAQSEAKMDEKMKIEELEKKMIHSSDPNISISVPEVTEMTRRTFSFPKIELHLHLDGAIRFTTILELAKKKGISLKGATTVEELKKVLVTHSPANLSKVLEAFLIFLPVVIGDLEAIERIAYELCEDQKANGVIYFEGRYGPHLLIDPVKYPDITMVDVVKAVKKGFDRGEKDFGVKARSIVCMIRGMDKKFPQMILDLATNGKDLGVVAIDVAGTAHGADEQYEQVVVDAFKEAAVRGIHRTVHAGESGGPKEVLKAIEEMKAERIGHGYRVMQNESEYEQYFIKEQRVHLEACPYSSVMTGAVPLDWKKHPVKRWAEDNVNFSISRDDPTCFDNSMLSEMQLVHSSIGLTTEQLWQAQVNAAKSCFLPEEEKQQLVELILEAKP